MSVAIVVSSAGAHALGWTLMLGVMLVAYWLKNGGGRGPDAWNSL